MQTDEKEKQYVVMKNELALARQKLNVHEAKAIRMALSCVDDRNDKEFYEFKYDLNDISSLLDTDKDSAARNFKNVGKTLAEQTVDIRIGDKDSDWLYIPLFKKIMYKNGILHIWFNEELRPYLLDLRTNFLKYDHELAKIFKSIYSIRIYEALKALYGEKKGLTNTFELSVQRLREITDTEEKYKSFSNFRKRVLDVAVAEISNYSDFSVSYELKKLGKAYDVVIFTMTEKEVVIIPEEPTVEAELPAESTVSDAEFIFVLTDLLSVTETCTFSQAEKIYLHYDKKRDDLLNNIKFAKKKSGIKNLIGYVWDAKNRELTDQPLSKETPKYKKKAKKDPLEPMSDERLKAYEEHEAAITDPGYMENLFKDWDDIDII